MQLRKAQVTNFKIVEDSTDFKLDRVTCLVGKNESGKTALLEALYRLNPYYSEDSTFDKVEEYPRRYLTEYDERHGRQAARVVTTHWELETSDVAAVESVLGPGALKSNNILVYKSYDEKGTIWNVDLDEAKIVAHLASSAGLHTEEAAPALEHRTITGLKQYIEAKAATLSEREKVVQAAIGKFRDGSPYKAAIDALTLPKFLLFADYDSMSGNVALDDLLRRKATNNAKEIKAGERVFFALLGLVGTSLEEINKIDKFEPLKARLEAASNKITRDVFKYWTQNRHLRVLFSLDAALPGDPAPFNSGKILHTRIYNNLHDVSVNFDERSRGFVWFFSFLVLFSQVKKNYGNNVIILLDEPGLSLHAKAQGDLLHYIEEQLKPNHQVIYTTHSPFMVDSTNLLAARTVEDFVTYDDHGQVKEIRGTKVGDDVLSTDKDTLFPLQGALGYEITQTLFVGKNTLLVEGPSDYLYLKAFSAELKKRNRVALDVRWTITPVGGIDKVAAFMSLFGGNKLHVAILMDYAHGQKKKVEDVRRSKLLQENHVLTCDVFAGKPEADLEDVIGWHNYEKLVNACYGLDGGQALNDPVEGATRVTAKVEERFMTMPPDTPEFDHYAPAEYLFQNREATLKDFPESDEALSRFERIFTQLNEMLAKAM
jgi:predicted ATP-dependent endonuclease of OLD family